MVVGKPKRGEKYLKVDFTFKNISDSDQDFSVHDFDCYVEDAFCEQWDVPPLTLDMYHEGTTLSAGEEISFSNLYAVPEDADSAELEYNKGEWTQERVIVELKK